MLHICFETTLNHTHVVPKNLIILSTEPNERTGGLYCFVSIIGSFQSLPVTSEVYTELGRGLLGIDLSTDLNLEG